MPEQRRGEPLFVYLLFTIIFICVVIILIEYVWLFILARRRAKQRNFYMESVKKINDMFYGATHSLSEANLVDEIISLKKYVGNHEVRMDIITEFIYRFLITDDDETDKEIKTKEKQICVRIFHELNPNSFYKNMLSKGNQFQKAFACRKLSEFNAVENTKTIRGFTNSGNIELKYHSVMALSALGDHDGLVAAFTGAPINKSNFSHRIMLEVLDSYTGDRAALVKDILKKCNDYIKSIVIKSVAKYNDSELSAEFLAGLTSTDINVKIASIRALGSLGDTQYEHELIIMTNDKEWSVRAAAVKSLSKYHSEKAVQAMIKATQDQNWWVRNNAAKTLVDMDEGLVYSKQIINGYDRYAADAVKSAIYKKYKI